MLRGFMLKLSITVLGILLMFVQKTHAGEKSLYDFLWLDPDKKVYVLQNKLYRKEHTFYMDVGYLSNFTSKFQDTNGYQIKGGFYVWEEWGIELFYNKYNNSNNDAYSEIQAINQQEPFIRRLNSSYGALIVWAPFYGKINTFNQIFYFDWSFATGLTSIKAESNLKSVTDPLAPAVYNAESYTGAVLKSNLKLHLRKNIHLGLEYMNTYYRAAGAKAPTTKKLRTNTDVIMSVGFSF